MRKSQLNLVSIILPTFNEAENIIPLIKAILHIHIKPLEIIVVDDDSPDGTSQLVTTYIRSHPKSGVRIETRYQAPGLTNSLKRGIELARGEIVVWLDCDFSMPPSLIPKLLKEIYTGADVAVGSRFIKGGKFKQVDRGQRDSPLAVILSRLMNYSIQFLLRSNFFDYTSGFIAVKKEILKRIPLRGDYGEYFIDFIYKCLSYHYNVVEIPYTCLPRVRGQSKTGQNLWQYYNRGKKYIFMTFLLLFERYLYRKFP